jgi:hypothetical protein
MSAPGGPGPAPGGPPLPGWLGPIVTVTTQVGVPTVFAGVLLWFVLLKVGGAMEAMQKGEEDRTRVMAAMQDTLIAALDRLGARFEKAVDENIRVNRELASHYASPPAPSR